MMLHNRNDKFDLQASQGEIAEYQLEWLLTGNGKVEVKTEDWLWERTGNICIEFECRGRPSGLAVTEAEMWAHRLTRNKGKDTVLWIMIPVERLKELCRAAFKAGHWREDVGDGGQSKVVLLDIE